LSRLWVLSTCALSSRQGTCIKQQNASFMPNNNFSIVIKYEN